jgi:hypothetical protein
MEQLTDIYPSTLAAWDFRDRNEAFKGTPHQAFGALNFARRANVQQMLPIAFYTCCVLSPEAFLEGIVWASGECPALTQNDLLACLTGREKLRHGTQFEVFSFAYQHSPLGCSGGVRGCCPVARLGGEKRAAGVGMGPAEHHG